MPPTPSRHRQTQNKLKATHFWQPSPPKPSPWSVHYKITRENTYLLYTATVKTAAKTAPPTPWVVSPNSKPWDFSISQEFMKATVDLGDLVGLHLVMSRNAGKGEYKVMVAALGWATAELIMSRCLYPSLGRGPGHRLGNSFPLSQTALTFVHYIAVSALVWMFTRYDLPRNFRPPLTLLLGISVYKAFILEAFVHLFSLGSWTALLVRAVMTGVLALSSLSLFVTLVHGN
uniref:BOS complex subunit TMEM147 n=1 Tax=Sarcophilus harrisii TaxID=9305 RepID=A0A7N4UYQ8_SARHA